MKRGLTGLVILLLITVDQLTKYLIVNWLVPPETFVLVPGVLQFRYTENTGAVFGVFRNATHILTVSSLLIVLVVLFILFSGKVKKNVLYVSLVMVVAGGIGNLIDRLTKGYVIDFIEPLFINFAVFNFADCLITVGECLMLGFFVCEFIAEAKKARNEN